MRRRVVKRERSIVPATDDLTVDHDDRPDGNLSGSRARARLSSRATRMKRSCSCIGDLNDDTSPDGAWSDRRDSNPRPTGS